MPATADIAVFHTELEAKRAKKKRPQTARSDARQSERRSELNRLKSHMANTAERVESPFSISDRVEQSVSTQASNPLASWLLHAGGLTVLVGLSMGALIAQALKSDQTGFSLMLVLIFGAALARGLADVLYINRETSLLNDQIHKLVASPQIAQFLVRVRASLFRDHVRNLYEIARRDQQVSQDNLVVLIQSRIASRTRLVELASGLLVTLGFIGTVLGLIASVGGLGTVIDSVGEDQSGLLTGLKATFGGMGTAFYTTLIGAVLGGVVLRVLAAVTSTHADRLVASIAELSEIYIVPSLRKIARLASN